MFWFLILDTWFLGLILNGYYLLHNCKQYTTRELRNSFPTIFSNRVCSPIHFVLTKLFSYMFQVVMRSLLSFWNLDLDLRFTKFYFRLLVLKRCILVISFQCNKLLSQCINIYISSPWAIEQSLPRDTSMFPPSVGVLQIGIRAVVIGN
jgi:hypothetical protein